MKKIALLLPLLILPSFAYAIDEEITLSPLDQLKENIQTKADEWLPTIKIFLSEKWVCTDILANRVINAWYSPIIENFSKPIEDRTAIYKAQTDPLKKEILDIETQIDEHELTIEEKKKEFLDSIGITTDYQKILEDIKLMQSELLTLIWNLNVKKKELETVSEAYEKFAYMSREDITQRMENAILKHCKAWYGKVELSDKKTLDVKKTELTNQLGPTKKKNSSKYKAVLEKISIMYIKNPENVKKLLSRIQKVLPKISKDHKYYELLVDIKLHVEKLVAEEE